MHTWIRTALLSLVPVAVLGAAAYFGYGAYTDSLKSSPPSRTPDPARTLVQDDVTAMTRPGVVKIVRRVEGEIAIPDFDVWIDKAPEGGIDVSVRFKNEAKDVTPTPIDETYAYGSGFFVTDDGYILTNSHVVSRESDKMPRIMGAFMNKLVAKMIYLDTSGETDKQWFKDIEAGIQDMDIDDLVRKYLDIFQEIGKRTRYDVEKTVRVIDPVASRGKALSQAFEEGIPVRTVSVNDLYWVDERDVALLKMEGAGFPGLIVSDTVPSVGSTIGVLGFPGGGEYNYRDTVDPTYSQGIISAEKDTRKADFRMIQTDAKISHGSSGGPLINDRGDVVGIVTSINPDSENGDTFAFGVPIRIVDETLRKNLVSADEPLPDLTGSGAYAARFREALALESIDACGRAGELFESASRTDARFSTVAYVQPYEARCRDMVAAGESVDSLYDEKLAAWNGTDYPLIVAVASAAVLSIVSVAVIVIIGRKRAAAAENPFS